MTVTLVTKTAIYIQNSAVMRLGAVDDEKLFLFMYTTFYNF